MKVAIIPEGCSGANITLFFTGETSGETFLIFNYFLLLLPIYLKSGFYKVLWDFQHNYKASKSQFYSPAPGTKKQD